MRTLEFGGVTVDRVVESEGPSYFPDFIFPDATENGMAAEMDWLLPHFFDPASGRLLMSLHSYVIRTRHHTVLVDTCVGNHKPRNREMFDHAVFPWMENFLSLGIAPEDIDYVLCTHMHVDHVGWNTKLEDGRWVPTFPNAKYIFARTELEYWKQQSEQDQMTRTGDYIADSVVPILEAKQEVLVDIDHQLDEGLTLQPLPGHTPGMVGLNINSGGSEAILCGDMMHHMIQCHIPDWSTLACADMEAARVTRMAFLERYAETDVTIVPSHFPNPTAGLIVPSGDTFGFRYVGE